MNYNNPIYLDIYNQYKKYIDLGIYKPNDKLPSVRILANDLGINPNTVARAYSLLESEGLICTLPKKGVYVKAINQINNQNLDLFKKQVVLLKNENISKNQLIDIITEVYNDQDN